MDLHHLQGPPNPALNHVTLKPAAWLDSTTSDFSLLALRWWNDLLHNSYSIFIFFDASYKALLYVASDYGVVLSISATWKNGVVGPLFNGKCRTIVKAHVISHPLHTPLLANLLQRWAIYSFIFSPKFPAIPPFQCAFLTFRNAVQVKAWSKLISHFLLSDSYKYLIISALRLQQFKFAWPNLYEKLWRLERWQG